MHPHCAEEETATKVEHLTGYPDLSLQCPFVNLTKSQLRN